MRYDAMTEDFEEITVFNKPALFTNIRIDKATVSGLLNIDPDRDWNFADGDCHTVNEFLDKYPPKNVERER